MKTLIILSAFLLVLSSCNKEMPVPDSGSGSDQVYTSDPGQGSNDDQGQDPDDGSDDGSDNGDPSTSCSTVHLGTTAVHPGQAR
jgi:hypothetical protein